MKDHKTVQRGHAPKSKPVHSAANASDRPESRPTTKLASSAPSDPHTLGRVKGGWLK